MPRQYYVPAVPTFDEPSAHRDSCIAWLVMKRYVIGTETKSALPIPVVRYATIYLDVSQTIGSAQRIPVL